MSTTQPHDGAQRQPATITVVQTLLVLSAVGSAVGLIVSIYLVGVLLDLVTRFQAALGPFAGAQQPGLSADTSSQLTVTGVLAVVDAVAVVAVSIWAYRAVGRARAGARVVLAVLAVVQVALSVAGTITADAGVGLVVVAALVGLLVFDAPVLFLLFVPAESRRWFAGSTPATSAPHGVTNPAGPPPVAWGPPTPTAPPRSAPFPAARPGGPYPSGPPQGPHGGSRPAGGRHSAPRPPQQ